MKRNDVFRGRDRCIDMSLAILPTIRQQERCLGGGIPSLADFRIHPTFISHFEIADVNRRDHGSADVFEAVDSEPAVARF
jgi:hypothetical protein